MKNFSFLLVFLLSITAISAQKDKTKVTAKKVESKAASFDSVTLVLQLDNCSAADSFSLWQAEGLFRDPILFTKPNGEGKFTFKLPRTEAPRFYFLGLNQESNQLRPVILGTEKEVLITGACFNPMNTEVKNSKINEDYNDAFRKANQLKIEMNKVVQNYQLNYNDANFRKQYEDEMLVVDKKKLALLDSLKKVSPFVGKIIALDTYTSYQHDPKKAAYKDELAYFTAQYFQYANLKDADYNNIPNIFELVRNYAQVILMPQYNLSRVQQKEIFNTLINSFPAQSMARKYALSGLMAKAFETQHPLSIDFSDRYLADFPTESDQRKGQITMMVNQIKAQMLEVPAPEIAQADTTGAIRKLSQMKGKVVLVDFWASWCGPCRKENPNVVKLYNKYKDNGFDIMSVSLDKDRAPWIKAINNDNLLWANHVSDLKFWSNEAARTYGVSSIPSTVLVDKEGLIIGRNLRGEALEQKLTQIFGF
jgi:thiol-disulfide isomerase/thioredoxin